MKAFFISSAIFIFIFIIIVFNSFYINKTADELERLTEAVDPNGDSAMKASLELEAFWKKHMKRIEFTVDHTMVNSIGLKIKNIKHFAEEGSENQLARELMLLKEELNELKRLDIISVHNIF